MAAQAALLQNILCLQPFEALHNLAIYSKSELITASLSPPSQGGDGGGLQCYPILCKSAKFFKTPNYYPFSNRNTGLIRWFQVANPLSIFYFLLSNNNNF